MSMKVPLKSICVIILERNKEISIASTIYKLRIGIDDELNRRSDIYVIDNGSTDDTAYVANKAGAGVIKYQKRRDREIIISKGVTLGVEKGHELTVILDRMGGNNAEDVLSLINAAVEQGREFASGYVVPFSGEDTIGCLALDRNQLKKLGSRGEEVSSYLLDLGRRENLREVVFNEDVMEISKKKEKKRGKRRSFRTRIVNFRRNHPLKFYGSMGLLVLMFALGFGFYTVDYFYTHQHLYYPTAFSTVLFIMIAGFLLVAGLMLNALNVLVEKIRTTRKWEREKKNRERRACK